MSPAVLNRIFTAGLVYPVLVLIAGLKLLGPDPDFLAYQEIIADSSRSRFYEPTFEVISYFNFLIDPNSPQITFTVYGIIAIALKIYLIQRYSIAKGFAFLIYIIVFYFLHEYTQVRVSVAIGFFLWSLVYHGSSLKYFMLMSILASAFHFSAGLGAVLGVIFWRQGRTLFNVCVTLPAIAAILFGVALTGMGDSSSNFLVTNSLLFVGHVEQMNAFNMMSLCFLLIYVIFLALYFLQLVKFDRFEKSLFLFYCIGLVIFFVSSSLGLVVVGYRFLEFFSTTLILLLPRVLVRFRQFYLVSFFFSIPVLLLGFKIAYSKILVI